MERAILLNLVENYDFAVLNLVGNWYFADSNLVESDKFIKFAQTIIKLIIQWQKESSKERYMTGF